MSFNLLDERWIPVLRNNGRAERVGIREALTDAGCTNQSSQRRRRPRVQHLYSA